MGEEEEGAVPQIPTLQNSWPVYDRSTAMDQFFQMQNLKRDRLLAFENEYIHNKGSFTQDEVDFFNNEAMAILGRRFGASGLPYGQQPQSADFGDKLGAFLLSAMDSAAFGLPSAAAGVLLDEESNPFDDLYDKAGTKGYAMAGNLLGYLVPGAIGAKAAAKAVNAGRGMGGLLARHFGKAGAQAGQAAKYEAIVGGVTGFNEGLVDERAADSDRVSLGRALTSGAVGAGLGGALGGGIGFGMNKLSERAARRAILEGGARAGGSVSPGGGPAGPSGGPLDDSALQRMTNVIGQARNEHSAAGKGYTQIKEIQGIVRPPAGVYDPKLYRSNSAVKIAKSELATEVDADALSAFSELAGSPSYASKSILASYQQALSDVHLAKQALSSYVDDTGRFLENARFGSDQKNAILARQAYDDATLQLKFADQAVKNALDVSLTRRASGMANEQALKVSTTLVNNLDDETRSALEAGIPGITNPDNPLTLSLAKRLSGALSMGADDIAASITEDNAGTLLRALVSEGSQNSLLGLRKNLGSAYFDMRRPMFERIPGRNILRNLGFDDVVSDSADNLVNEFMEEFGSNKEAKKMAGAIYKKIADSRNEEVASEVIEELRSALSDVRFVGELRMKGGRGKQSSFDRLMSRVTKAVKDGGDDAAKAADDASPAARKAAASAEPEPTPGEGVKFDAGQSPLDVGRDEQIAQFESVIRLTDRGKKMTPEELRAEAIKKLDEFLETA